MSLTTILFLGAAHAAFLASLIGSKRGKTLADAVLGAWLLTLSLHHLIHGLFFQGTSVPPSVVNLNAAIPLLQGPFLFLYVDTLTRGRRALRLGDAIHLLPFLATAGYLLIALPRLSHSSATVSVFRLNTWITGALLVSVPAYALASLRSLRRHQAAVLDQHSERHGRDLAWLRALIVGLLGVWAVVILTVLTPMATSSGSGHAIMGAVTLFIYAIGYCGWRQFAVAEEVDPAAARDEAPTPESPLPAEGASKYQRSGLKAEEITDLAARLEQYLDQQRPYLEPAVTLRSVAEALGTTPNHLSQALSQGLQKSFHDVINARRVDDFRRRVLDPRNRHRTLLAIALDSGFSSKSSFNRVFRQLCGESPAAYLKRQRGTADATGDES